MALINSLFQEKFLLEAWNKINKFNEESHGLSGETISNFELSLDTRILSIAKDLKNSKYRFSPTRAAIIPKDNGKPRPLQIPEIKDRVVLKALAIMLEKELKGVLCAGEGVSFAYQDGLGVQHAIQKMQEYYNKGCTYILEADIKDFFPTVNRNELLNQIFLNLSDQSLEKLIIDGIGQEVKGLDKIKEEHHHLFKNQNSGIPQGNPLSPLFSNIYLSSFDAKMKLANFGLIRYADDFIVMCKSKKEAEDAFELAKEIIEIKLHLELYPLKEKYNEKCSKIIEPTKDSFSFLSVAFDGSKIFPSRKSVDRFKAGIDKICYRKNEDQSVLNLLLKIKNSLNGWVSTYSYTDCARYFEEIDSYINKHVLISISKLDWKFTNKVKGKIPSKLRTSNQNPECLSMKQRKYSGVELCNDILTLRKMPKPDSIRKKKALENLKEKIANDESKKGKS